MVRVLVLCSGRLGVISAVWWSFLLLTLLAWLFVCGLRGGCGVVLRFFGACWRSCWRWRILGRWWRLVVGVGLLWGAIWCCRLTWPFEVFHTCLRVIENLMDAKSDGLIGATSLLILIQISHCRVRVESIRERRKAAARRLSTGCYSECVLALPFSMMPIISLFSTTGVQSHSPSTLNPLTPNLIS